MRSSAVVGPGILTSRARTLDFQHSRSSRRVWASRVQVAVFHRLQRVLSPVFRTFSSPWSSGLKRSTWPFSANYILIGFLFLCFLSPFHLTCPLVHTIFLFMMTRQC